jgi:hypothetical protein
MNGVHELSPRTKFQGKPTVFEPVGLKCSLWVQPSIFAIFSAMIILGERSSEHFLFLLARHFLPRYDVSNFRKKAWFQRYCIAGAFVVVLASQGCLFQPWRWVITLRWTWLTFTSCARTRTRFLRNFVQEWGSDQDEWLDVACEGARRKVTFLRAFRVYTLFGALG